MAFNVLFLAALCTEVVSGLAFEAAKATQHAKELESGWTPAPTAAPITPHELMKRQSANYFASTTLQGSDNTCGYLSGNGVIPYTCGTAATCEFWPARQTASLGVAACCIGATCEAAISCVNSRQYFTASSCNDECDNNELVLKCTNVARPYCNTAVFGDVNVLDFYCASKQVSTTQTFYTTYSGQTNGGKFSARVISDIVTSSSRRSGVASASRSAAGGGGFTFTNDDASSTPSTSSRRYTPTSIIGSSATSDPTDNTYIDYTPRKKSAPLGAIVGGVVGGIAVIAALLGFFLRRKRQKKYAAAAAVPVHTDSHDQAPPPVYTAPPPLTSEMDAAGKPPPMASVSEHGFFAPAPLPKVQGGDGSQYAQDPNNVLSANGGDTRRTSMTTAVSPISPPAQFASTAGSPPPPGARESFVSNDGQQNYPSYPPPGAHEVPPTAHELPPASYIAPPTAHEMPGSEARR